ncbi:MAG: transcription elongation factor Elf1 [Neolewinella sp.]
MVKPVFLDMTLKYFTCPNCHESARIRTFAPDRVELEKEKGERFKANCSHCHQVVDLHVNEVRAKANHTMTFVVIALCTVLWIIIFLFGLYRNIFILLSCTSLIGLPFAVRQATEKQATTFNDYLIREIR